MNLPRDRLDSGEDPDQWIQNLEQMRRKLQILGSSMSDMDLMIHILHNLPNEYETTLELLENDLENEVASLDRIKEKLRTKFERMGKSRNPMDGALVSSSKPQKYKGLCSYCGIYGHRGTECRKRLSKGSEKGRNVGPKDDAFFPGFCWKCNKKGHKSANCKLKTTVSEGNNDRVNLSRDSEIALIGTEGPSSCFSSNLWVGDTGATCHMVCREEGLFDCISSNQNVLVGDGRALNVEKVGKLKVRFAGRGQEVTDVLLEDVKVHSLSQEQPV